MQNENIYYTTDKFKDLTDEEIISQIKLGNEHALTYLLERCIKALRAIDLNAISEEKAGSSEKNAED